jgi:hypothetical protein
MGSADPGGIVAKDRWHSAVEFQELEVVGIGARAFEVGDCEAKAVQHHGGQVRLHLFARQCAECGGDALQTVACRRSRRRRGGAGIASSAAFCAAMPR